MASLLPTMLFVPGSSEKHLAKARTLRVPALILDLEDSVAASAKAAARSAVSQFSADFGLRTIFVRVNPPGSDWHERDLESVVRRGLSGIVLPKVESADTVRAVSSSLDRLEAQAGLEVGSLQIIATLETVAGVRRAAQIAAASPRIHCLGFGSGDFSADLGLQWPASDGQPSPTLVHAKVEVVLASREAGLMPPHDGAYALYKDLDGLRREAESAKRLGFLGKHAIHPDQVPVILDVFRPSEEELVQARHILEAFESQQSAGVGAFGMSGQMIDLAVAQRARGLLRLHEELGEMDANLDSRAVKSTPDLGEFEA